MSIEVIDKLPLDAKIKVAEALVLLESFEVFENMALDAEMRFMPRVRGLGERDLMSDYRVTEGKAQAYRELSNIAKELAEQKD